jgi:hypothetical protein
LLFILLFSIKTIKHHYQQQQQQQPINQSINTMSSKTHNGSHSTTRPGKRKERSSSPVSLQDSPSSSQPKTTTTSLKSNKRVSMASSQSLIPTPTFDLPSDFVTSPDRYELWTVRVPADWNVQLLEQETHAWTHDSAVTTHADWTLQPGHDVEHASFRVLVPHTTTTTTTTTASTEPTWQPLPCTLARHFNVMALAPLSLETSFNDDANTAVRHAYAPVPQKTHLRQRWRPWGCPRVTTTNNTATMQTVPSVVVSSSSHDAVMTAAPTAMTVPHSGAPSTTVVSLAENHTHSAAAAVAIVKQEATIVAANGTTHSQPPPPSIQHEHSTIKLESNNRNGDNQNDDDDKKQQHKREKQAKKEAKRAKKEAKKAMKHERKQVKMKLHDKEAVIEEA